MKKAFLTLGILATSVFANAADLTVDQQAQKVRINSATVQNEGTGFPVYRVKATATFGNSCQVPRDSEVLKLVDYKENYNTLDITVAEFNNNRVCPAVYMPVTVTLDLGTYTKPNDGTFKSILVNGKKAIRVAQ